MWCTVHPEGPAVTALYIPMGYSMTGYRLAPHGQKRSRSSGPLKCKQWHYGDVPVAARCSCRRGACSAIMPHRCL